MDGLLDIFTVSFFGHRYVEDFNFVGEAVKKVVEGLICEKEYVDFLVGRDGDFDYIVSSAIIRAKRELTDANSSHICVLPYERAEYRKNKAAFEQYYDEVEVCNDAAGTYPKAAFAIRNRSMVERSELCVFYVDHEQGGAWQTLRYAQRKGKRILNIFDME